MALEEPAPHATNAAQPQHHAEAKPGAEEQFLNRIWTPITRQPIWCAATWLLLALLVTWSYGANNLALPGIPIPLVDLMLIALIVGSRSWWRPLTMDGPGRTILVLLVLLSAYGGVRLLVDIPEHGLAAVRGSVFIVEAWAVFLGVGVARRLGRVNVERGVSIVFGTALVWFCLYPFRTQVIDLSPMVAGVQRSAPLFAFASLGFVSGLALLWFGTKRTNASAVASAVSVAVILMAQSRGVFAGITVASLVLLGMSRRRASHLLFKRLVTGGIAVIALLALLPPLPGRLGAVSFGTVIELVDTGIGREGEVSSSFDDRANWNKATIAAIEEKELGWVFGVGFGADLTDGFEVNGIRVATPHNDFLEFYARLGIGFFPWVGLWLVSSRTMFSRAGRGDQIALWGFASTMVIVAVSLTQPFSSFAYGGMVWWLLVGLVLGLAPTRTAN
tara:strand:- start:3541 stop:4878 length:1338 start_codon:yes stop_codon:yes gene_type:complete